MTTTEANRLSCHCSLAVAGPNSWTLPHGFMAARSCLGGFEFVASLLLLLVCPPVFAQTREPHLAYVYPAGGCRGESFQVLIGGQNLNGTSGIHCSGTGIKAEFLEYNRPMPQNRFNELRDELRTLQQKRQASRREPNSTNRWTSVDEKRVTEIQDMVLKNPPNRQGNPAMAEQVTLKVSIATNAEPGRREIRVRTPNGLSNPMVFCVGELREFSHPAAEPTSPEIERLRKQFGAPPAARPARSEMKVSLPAVINGQIMPGGVDRFRFTARRGQELVAAANARSLIPYLADAVPGWFQATLALYDAKGNELKFDDDFQFRPDPVFHFVIPRDGEYVLEIRDAMYRGREDFVYRIELGELPFVTGLFPLGSQVDVNTTVQVTGWNLPATEIACRESEPGLRWVAGSWEKQSSCPMPFAVDTRPEQSESEPNDTSRNAQTLSLPVTVNGRIGEPGDKDLFQIHGRAGEVLVAEVWARRLESPLDSALTLTDESGVQLAFNDDHEDKASGLNTHHADSYLRITLPRDGTYFVQLVDRQSKAGPEYAYRLRLGPPEPDFELRVVPSAINARSGASVPVAVYALRKDGFTNEIRLVLQDAPPGFAIKGGVIPGGEEQVKLTLTVPVIARGDLVDLSIRGLAEIEGRPVIRDAVPADDLMQAFIYRHLVPAQELKLAISRGRASGGR